MPIKLKNQNIIPDSNYDTVHIFGLDIPKLRRKDLPGGPLMDLVDISNMRDRGEIGEFDFVRRAFCTFTRLLPKHEHVRLEWFYQQRLEEDEVREMTTGTLELLTYVFPADDGGDGGNARKATKKTSSSTQSA
jgi:hypothetical protein